MSIEWAAGLFEGEGHIRKFSPLKYDYAVHIKMTDLDILDRFEEMFGGTIKRRPLTAPHHKPIWEWRLGTKAKVKNFLVLMIPHFGYRRTYLAQNLLDAMDAC